MQKNANHPGSDLEFGNQLVGSALTGFGGGAAATALYYLVDRLRREKQKKKIMPEELTAISSGGPVVAEAPQKLASVAGTALTGGLLGALGGGAYGVLTGDEKNTDLKSRLRNVLRHAAAGGAVGAGLGAAYEPTVATLGRYGVPVGYLPALSLPFGSNADVPEPKNWTHEAWLNIANLGALGGGALGGRALVNHLAKKDKSKENDDAVESARKEYFAALSGQNDKAAVAIDTCFDNFKKQASIFGTAYTGMLLAALGGAGIGGTYMYDRTKKLSDAENLRRALEHRARMRGVPPPLVDPDELAAVKQLALSKEQPEKLRLEYSPSAKV